MFKRILNMSLAMLLMLVSLSPMTEVSAETVNNGTTYYVSTLNGKDSNDGKSKKQAFYSIQKINDIELQAGDEVLLEADSVFVDGYLHVKGSGSEQTPIIVDRYGEGNDPIIETNGQGIWYQNYGKTLDNPRHKNKGYVSSSILLFDVEYIEINNLEMTNDPDMYGERYSDLDKMNRTGVAAVAQNAGTVNHIHLKGLNIHDVRGNVYDKHMNNGGIYFTVFNPINEEETGIARYNDVLIEDTIVNDVSRWGIAVGYTAYSNHFLAAEIADSTIEKYGSSNVIIRNNYIQDAGGDAITVMYLDRPMIEHNVAQGTAKEINDEIYSETDFGKVAAGIWPWKSKDPVFQFNEAFDTNFNGDGQAWDADYGDGALYQYNYSHNNGGGALMVCLWDAVNTTFRYNISQNDLSGVLNLPNNPDAHIYNNTFYMKEGVDFIRDGMTGGTALIENNIIHNDGATKSENWTKNSKLTYSNNLYFNYENLPVSDKSAVTGDPMFVNGGTAPFAKKVVDGSVITHERDAFKGYKLQDNSPAVGKGKVISNNGGFDFFGNKVVGTPDIGAFQSKIIASDISIDSNVYMIEGTDIKGVMKDTTVAEFMSNLIYDERFIVTNEFDEELVNEDIVTAGFKVKFSNGTVDTIYNVVGNNDNEIKSSIYMIDDAKQEIYVPILNTNPTSVDDFKKGLTIDSTADIKVLDGDSIITDVISEGMTLNVIAENGDVKIYKIVSKTDYHYINDYVTEQQGNVWFAQNKIGDNYKNLTKYSGQYAVWEGYQFSAVGREGTKDSIITESTHGLIVDFKESSESNGHSIAYRAPKSGLVTLSFKDDEPRLRQITADSPNTKGDVILSITLNGETISGPHTLPRDGTKKVIGLEDITVNEGDFIRVEVNTVDNPEKFGVFATPQIKYQEMEESLNVELLKLSIEEADKLSNEDNIYTASSFETLKNTLIAAKIILIEAETQDQIDEAVNELNSAISGLEKVKEVNKSYLEIKLNEAKEIDIDKYTEVTSSLLVDAIATAGVVLENLDATQDEVDSQVIDLQTAIDALEEKVMVDTSLLEAKITKTRAMDLSKYTDSTVANLNDAITTAEAVLADVDATQVEVNAQVVALQTAINALELKEELPVSDYDTALAALRKADASRNAEDLADAKALINSMSSGWQKTRLMNRLNVIDGQVQAAAAYAEALEAVRVADASRTTEDIAAARTLVEALDAGTGRTRLMNQLNTIEAQVNVGVTYEEALAALRTADASRKAEDIEIARDLASQLLEGWQKTRLENRLSVIDAQEL